MSEQVVTAGVDAPPSHLPRVTELGTLALALVVIGGIAMASYVPRRPPLAIPSALFAVAAALLVVDVVMMSRLKVFAWDTFFLVYRWALLAYVVSGGMIEFAFVRNHTRGAPLVVISLLLAVFVVDVPLLIAFTVARFRPMRSVPA